VYADITLAIRFLFNQVDSIKRAMIVDLDAHQVRRLCAALHSVVLKTVVCYRASVIGMHTIQNAISFFRVCPSVHHIVVLYLNECTYRETFFLHMLAALL